jgi:hypothetical protein
MRERPLTFICLSWINHDHSYILWFFDAERGNAGREYNGPPNVLAGSSPGATADMGFKRGRGSEFLRLDHAGDAIHAPRRGTYFMCGLFPYTRH